jgi:hypothetical protein
VVIVAVIGAAILFRPAGARTEQSVPTPSSTGYPAVHVQEGKECARSGSGAFAAVGTSNKTTTCPFAINVRTAYVKAYPDGGSGTVEAYSPATKKDYSMACTGSQPVRCSGGVAAQVIIYGGRLQVG